jgi:hypothetical protein
MMKGITITADNQSSIAVQYGIDLDDIDDMLPVGYILIVSFSAEKYDGVISAQTFASLFTKGAILENDYFEVVSQ